MAKNQTDQDEIAIVAIGRVQETHLAVAATSRLTSLDNLIEQPQLSLEQVEGLPLILLQQTDVATTAWAHVAKTVTYIRETGVWETTDGGKYKGDWDGFLKQFTSGLDYSQAKISNLLGYYNWFVANEHNIKDAKPSETSYEVPLTLLLIIAPTFCFLYSKLCS